MNKIEKLIEEHCPNGVEYKPLGEIFKTRNGYTPSKSNSSFWSNGTVNWFRMEDIRENGRILDSSLQKISSSAVKGELFPADTILVATSATIGEHALVTVPHLSNQRFTALMLRPEYNDSFDIKFLFYCCFNLSNWCKRNTTQSSFLSVDMKKFKKFLFPIPPICVQKEIVKILDTFQELEARKKQYEFYRDQLLTFTERERERERVRWSPLSDLCFINRGKVISKDYLAAHKGPFPVFSSQTANAGVFGWIDSYDYDFESITWTTDGANAGSVFYHSEAEKFSITNVCGLLRVKDENQLLTKYLYFYLTVEAKRHVSTGMGNPKLMSTAMKQIQIPIPPLEEQQRIVNILDQFDALVNDLTSGLPAEIEARRKQYEYYRDQLLTFKELAA